MAELRAAVVWLLIENADYATYLLRLTERELIERQARAADRRIKAGAFPAIKIILEKWKP
jgi:hypothetical protein